MASPKEFQASMNLGVQNGHRLWVSGSSLRNMALRGMNLHTGPLWQQDRTCHQ